MKVSRFLSFLICVLVLLGFPVCVHLPITVVGNETNVNDLVSPVIQDFYINNTWAHESTQFSFNVTDNVALDHAIFACNVTQDFVNDSSIPLVGTQAWANVTHTLPSYNCTVSFQLWLWNSNGSMSTTGLRYMKVYTYNNASGAWNTPFISLSQAIQAIDSANNWANVEIYAQTILAKKTTTDLANMIDSYASSGDWSDVLEWSAICSKLGISRQNAILNALGNSTMVGSLPQEGIDSKGNPCFDTRYKAVLYGYYWAAQYNVSLTKWNITAAYNQFNSSIYNLGKPALWIYANGTAYSHSDRYYDEGACTVDCYIIFAELLNVSGALNDALHWWSYDDSMHWSSTGQFYKYTPYSSIYECEAPFFLKIISILKYYYPSLTNWNRVLTDIGNRFLSSEWNSPQWGGANVVIHANPGNPQRRLANTLGAWQSLLGTKMQLNSVYQSNVKDMLCGSNATEPAWALLIGSQAQQGRGGLFDYPNDLFVWGTSQPNDNNATAYGEILLFLMGIVPENTTIAFPLEELKYEYIQDIDPQMFQFDLRTQTTTIPVDGAGNMTFQYGTSPVTYVFNQSGIWQITFSNSWNMITNVTYVSALPTNRIYFTRIYTPTLHYDATINAHCITEVADVNVAILMDGSPTGYTTPHTFTGLNATHTFTVPNNDTNGDPLKQWNTGQTSTTITVSSAGTYTAYYGPSPIHDIAITDIEPSKTVVGQNHSLNVNVTVGNPGDYPETFNVTLYANTTAIGNPTVTYLPNATFTHIIFAWNTTGFACGNYTLSAYAHPVSDETDIADNNFTGGWVVVAGVGDLTGGTPNPLDFVPDGKVLIEDVAVVAKYYGQMVPPAPANCDVSGPTIGVPDGKVDITDVATVAKHFGQRY